MANVHTWEVALGHCRLWAVSIFATKAKGDLGAAGHLQQQHLMLSTCARYSVCIFITATANSGGWQAPLQKSESYLHCHSRGELEKVCI